ncbi:MAG: hypothetical protein H6648_11495 [Caldilineae bacterium]|nr:hypothetical protein [Caldilineae bacterium]
MAAPCSWVLAAGEIGAGYGLHLAFGLAYHLVLLAWLMRRGHRSVLR